MNTKICDNCAFKGASKDRQHCAICKLSLESNFFNPGDDEDEEESNFRPTSTERKSIMVKSLRSELKPPEMSSAAAASASAAAVEVCDIDDLIDRLGVEDAKEAEMIRETIEAYSQIIQPVYAVEGIIERSEDEKKVVLSRCNDNNECVVTISLNSDTGETEFLGLPFELASHLNNFTHEEKWEDPEGVLSTIVSMHAAMSS